MHIQKAVTTQGPQSKRVLNAGSGPRNARPLHPAFVREGWREVRLDIDAAARPDVVGSIIELSATFPARSFDAIWSSHILEHLYAHQVHSALTEFRHVLKPDGFALITSPDLEAIAAILLKHGLDHVAYNSRAGPITTRDLLFGHTPSIARGQIYMAHKSGFTCVSLGQQLVDAGFPTVLAKNDRLDLWVVALMEHADKGAIQRQLAAGGLEMFEDSTGNQTTAKPK
jgi:SAM-dependent methyltransferase